jgi:hypothetical protein
MALDPRWMRRRLSYSRLMARQRPGKPNIARLQRAVDAAVVATNTPPEPGMESWPFTFPQDHLSRDDRLLLWDVVRYVRREHRDVFRKFVRERTVYDHIFEYLAEADRPTLARVITDLRRRGQPRKWLVEVPLLNLIPPRETVPVAKGAMLVRTDQTRQTQRAGRRFRSHLRDAWAVQNHLGDELTPLPRWLRASQLSDVDIDTRRGASLLLVEQGTEELAVTLAGTRARLAVALWCLLSPPRSSSHPRQTWPTVGGWTPAPHVELGVQRKRYRPGQFGGPAGVRGARITTHAEYRLTRSEDYLRAPFDAIDAARRGGLAARAVLSAARSLYLAERTPPDLEGTERILHVWRAKEALSDPGTRGEKADERWRRLVVNLRLRSELRAGGYSREEIDEAFDLMKSLRQLATHRPDDVLVNLSYPDRLSTHLHGGSVIDAASAPLAVVVADWPVLLGAVRSAARRLAKGALRNGWSDKWFHSRFA